MIDQPVELLPGQSQREEFVQQTVGSRDDAAGSNASYLHKPLNLHPPRIPINDSR